MTTPTARRAWGRLEQFDEASRAYGIAEHLQAAGAPTEPTTQDWATPHPIPLDQGDTPHCVPFAGVGHRIAAPVQTLGLGNGIAHALYSRCKAIDGLGTTVQGTSVLAIAKVFKSDGVIDEYRWCLGENDLALAVSHVCPVVIGVQWRANMMDPDERGFLHVSGADEGGHCVLVTKIDAEQDHYEVLCAWNRWGINGTGKARVTRDDMAKLLAARGDALVMIEHPGATPTTTAPTTTPTTDTPPVTPEPPAPKPAPKPAHHWRWPFNRRVINR